MKRIISTLLTLLIPILISAQCWIEQGVQDMSNPDISSEFKALFKSENSEYADAYRLLHNQAFNLRNDVSILKKLNNTFEYVVNNLENVNEAFLRSNIVHLDLAGYNRYPEAVKLVSTKKLDDEVTDIENLLFGKIQDYTPKFKNASVDRITLENAPYTDDILAEINRITKDGASIELEHFSDLNIPYNEVADKVGGGIHDTKKIVKEGYEYTRVTIIKGAKGFSELETSIRETLKVSGLSVSQIDDILIRSAYIDDAWGSSNRMTKMLDDLLNNSSGGKLLNPEDIFTTKNSDSWFNFVPKDGNFKIGDDFLSFFNELKTGLKEMNNGSNVVISRKIKKDGTSYNYSGNGNELDVLNVSELKIIECKRARRDKPQNIRDQLNAIIDKFTEPSKLSAENKSKYFNHFGQLEIGNPLNPYYNLSKDKFLERLRNEFFINDGAGGVKKDLLEKSIIELEVVSGQKNFIIKSTEW